MAITHDNALVVALPSKRDGGDATQNYTAAHVQHCAMPYKINVEGVDDGQKRRADDVGVAVCATNAEMRASGRERQAVDDGAGVFGARNGRRMLQRQHFEGFCKCAVGLKHLVKVHLRDA